LISAAAALLEASDVEGAAAAEKILSQLLWTEGRVPEAIERSTRAMQLLADRPATPEKAELLLAHWRNLWLAGRPPADDILEQAIVVAERLGRKDLIVDARINLALLHGFSGGDDAAIGEHEEAIALAREIGTPDITRGYINLASLHDWRGAKHLSAALHLEGWSLAKRFGDTARGRFLEGEVLLDLLSSGQWDEALAQGQAYIELCRSSPHYMEGPVRIAVAAILLGRDELGEARRHLDRACALALEIKDPQVAVPAYSARARFCAETGDTAGAVEALGLLPDTSASPSILLDPAYVEAAIAATDARVPDTLTQILTSRSVETAWKEAIAAIAEARLADASRACARAHERHYASLLTMRATERGEVVAPDLTREAMTFFRSVKATRYLARMERGADAVLIDSAWAG
jgi:tetratricopeptide (TPR) repeat protein